MRKIFYFLIIGILCITPIFIYGDNGAADPDAADLETDSYDIKITTEEEGANDRTITLEYDGIVPCGRCLTYKSGDSYNPYLDNVHDCNSDQTFIPCTICHLFIIFDRIISFVLTTLIPSLALLIIIIAGLLLITNVITPDQVNKAKKILLAAVAGFILSYLAWALTAFMISYFMEWDIEWNDGIEVHHICEMSIKELDFDR